jgi:putative Mg2+ transporter-C (MgtC) family protein
MDWFSDLPQLGLIALAGALGGLIGLEREFADKPAGLRTHFLVGAGSALLMVLGDAVIEEFQQQAEVRRSIQADPIRVIQAIVVGISFLGAGTIIHERGRVEGLTTAASIFLTAGIGVAVAADRIRLAIGVTLLALVVLLVVGYVERWFGKTDRMERKRIDRKSA